mgnify:CR=1 FL=1
MTQKERRVFLINYLKNEEESFKGIVIPHDTEAQKHLLRALMNVRPPMPVSKDFTEIQGEYLQQEKAAWDCIPWLFISGTAGDLSLARGYYPPFC